MSQQQQQKQQATSDSVLESWATTIIRFTTTLLNNPNAIVEGSESSSKSVQQEVLLLKLHNTNTNNNNGNATYIFAAATVATIISTTAAIFIRNFLQEVSRNRRRRISDNSRETEQGKLKASSTCVPLIQYNDPTVCATILNQSLHHGKSWITRQQQQQFAYTQGFTFRPLIGQVGGISKQKLVLLSYGEYVLKPMRNDFRRIREIGFYEIINLLSAGTTNPNHQYRTIVDIYIKFVSGICSENPTIVQNRSLWRFIVSLLSYPHQSQNASRIPSSVWDNQQQLDQEIQSLQRLSKFIPQYYGVITMDQIQRTQNDTLKLNATNSNPEHSQKSILQSDEQAGNHKVDGMEVFNDTASYVILQDITYKYNRPCIMDVKIGLQTYEPDANTAKQQKEYSKYTQQAIFGIRIVGIRVYNPKSNSFTYFDKEYGKKLLSYNDLVTAFRIFLTGNDEQRLSQNTSNAVDNITKLFLEHVNSIMEWFAHYNKSLTFYASSLLLVYEGNPGGTDEEDDGIIPSTEQLHDNNIEHSTTTNPIIKMIDFGRVRRQLGGDDGYLAGLQTIRSIFNDILEYNE